MVEEGSQPLKLFSDSQQPVDCIRFGNTYFGTDTVKSVVLCNASSTVQSFVISLEESGPGQLLGTDLSLTTEALLRTEPPPGGGEGELDVASLVTIRPSEGCLQPQEKITVYFCFHPRIRTSKHGFKSRTKMPARRDYVLFARVNLIGSDHAAKKGGSVEVCLTGTALPILVSSSVSKLQFGTCDMSEKVSRTCSLRNESPLLPVKFRFGKMAHFTFEPSRGRVEPGKTLEISMCFNPSQYGIFRTSVEIEILGTAVASSGRLGTEAVLAVPVKLSATCQSKLRRREERSPAVVHPDERARSIRPSNPSQPCRTEHTGLWRYTYTDPDYAFNNEESKERRAHKDRYQNYIADVRCRRLKKEKELEQRNVVSNTDVRLKPNSTKKKKQPPSRYKRRGTARDTDDVWTPSEQSSQPVRVVEAGYKAVASTQQEIADCRVRLSPGQLYQLKIGPAVLDFGEICVHSTMTKQLTITNNLTTHVLMEINEDCADVFRESALSHVILPRSETTLPVILEPEEKGMLCRCVSYTLNGHYHDKVQLTADVVPVALQLSATDILLTATPGMPPHAEFRSVVTLYNRRNLAAEFSWVPDIGDNGTSFSVRPAVGMVAPYSGLDCEVVYHPSFAGLTDGYFQLQVHHGNTLYLHCEAEYRGSTVQLAERSLHCGAIALNLRTLRTAVMHNTGTHNAYFQIVNPNPVPNFYITPREGVVPVGGFAELRLEMAPQTVLRFDTRVFIAVRCGKTLEMRIGGRVEAPSVDIDTPSFKFGGVWCGSEIRLPFKLSNRGNTRAQVEFDFTHYRDFSLTLDDATDCDGCQEEGVDGSVAPVYTTELAAGTSIGAELVFAPTEVASYDFLLPVMLNDSIAPSPTPTPFPPSPAPIAKRQTEAAQRPTAPPTPCRRIIATALRCPLVVSEKEIELVVPQMFDGCKRSVKKDITVRNPGGERVEWHLDTSHPLLQQHVFSICATDGATSGCLAAGEAVTLTMTWTVLHVRFGGNFRSDGPRVAFSPRSLVLTPTPLNASVTAEVQLVATGYDR
ncbi:PREDICTED: cilia- and flagella-associated protein 47-like [Priapulus caudatus]|uniref:Cilia- and flagella-associated protein 47-like n=1 Tax=Priapulus caudatus TaxID=37621 RepID=A0ABM1ERC3_PRICU|nr:PREDICTED: cilia- and flagella-associated protein 47-like [Priapulus caudatus]